MRIEWKSNLQGVARCPADFKLLGEDEAAGTFETYVAIFGTPDRPDFFGDSDVIEAGAFTQALQGIGLRIKARLFLDDDGSGMVRGVPGRGG